jgi:hypothetical protein
VTEMGGAVAASSPVADGRGTALRVTLPRHHRP